VQSVGMSTSIRTATIPLVGPYDLGEVALMGFGHRDESTFDGVMRLAFCTDALDTQVGVEVRQDGDALALTVHGEGDLAAISAQVARVVSADHDGDAWVAVCASDPVLARLHAAAPGFRPSNFYSPYEAAVWAVLSARRARRQGITLRERLSREQGAVFHLAGRAEPAVPLPQQLLALDAFPGLPTDRIPRLHAIARAALDGLLDVPRLVSIDPTAAMLELQRLPGIGPFYSALIVIRACGSADALPVVEEHTRAAVQALYGGEHTLDDARIAAIAESWRPFRTWAAVALRAVGSRLPQ